MQIKIGDKIRELRRRDGRKQEDLANALGVTCQAVSRWESNGGYPDMEMVPAIANFFHISIDELFGYSGDREARVKEILAKADKFFSKGGDFTECIDMLRSAADEFPSEPQILLKLGYALGAQGAYAHGAKGIKKENSDYVDYDTDYNNENVYWQEELKIFEKVLTMNISPEDREAVIMMTVLHQSVMGNNEKAKEIAQKQCSVIASRETLLPKATVAEEKDRYQGEAIIALLTELKNIIVPAIGTKKSLYSSADGIKILLELAHLYEAVFGNKNCGIANSHLAELYLQAAAYEVHFCKDTEKALEYFETAFTHRKIYNEIGGRGEYCYSAPLVEKVTFPRANFPKGNDALWQAYLKGFPQEMTSKIKSERKYRELFK